MHIKALTLGSPLETITLHSAGGALALWATVLWNEAPKWAYGPICGESVGLLGHCPLCYPAAALTLVSLFGAARLFQLRLRA